MDDMDGSPKGERVGTGESIEAANHFFKSCAIAANW
jgi:hypothetical protein